MLKISIKMSFNVIHTKSYKMQLTIMQIMASVFPLAIFSLKIKASPSGSKQQQIP